MKPVHTGQVAILVRTLTWYIRKTNRTQEQTAKRLTGFKAGRGRWCCRVKNTRGIIHVKFTVRRGRRCRRRGRAGWQTINIHVLVRQLTAVGRWREAGWGMSSAWQCTRTAKQTAGWTYAAKTAIHYTRLTRNKIVSCRNRRLRFDAWRLERILTSSLLKQQQTTLMLFWPQTLNTSSSQLTTLCWNVKTCSHLQTNYY